MEKLCVFCEHFDWSRVSVYSPLTPDLNGGASCLKKHYIDEQPSDNSEFRKLILKAESCSDYEPEALSK